MKRFSHVLQTVAGHTLAFPAKANGVLPVMTAAGMREADRLTIETFGVPGFTLMETAGRAAAAAIVQRYGPAEHLSVAVFCGKGNNGGDGFVAARVLYAQGARVQVWTTAPEDDLSSDAKHHFKLLNTLQEHCSDERLVIFPYEGPHSLRALHADLYIDALLGTGLTSDLRSPVSDIVGWLNLQEEPVVALDLPSGLHSDTGAAMGLSVQADLTVTMGALKSGLLLADGPASAGDIHVAEIGIPDHLIEEARSSRPSGKMATDVAVRAWLPRRAAHSHKYSVGLALVVGGSPGLTGAPTMSSLAAARAGAGAVVCACPETAQPVLATKLTEVMTLGLPVSPAGGIDPEGGMKALKGRLEKANVVLAGPGIGRDPDTQHFIRRLIAETDLPVVIDADGLNALAGHMDFVRQHSGGRWILTPHAGEFKRLAGADADLSDGMEVVRRFAAAWDCVLILKGLPSLVGCPDGTVYINGTGNPALATAGTGDVLAGLCAGLLAQGLTPEHAAVCALHLGGAAADRYRDRLDARTLQALDLLDELPHVMRERFS